MKLGNEILVFYLISYYSIIKKLTKFYKINNPNKN
ncbi:hypothetical protein MCETHM1_03478 [Flavobacteriaceae bacterium]